jgi:predicted Ser/Thr protein kinase
MVRGYRVIRTIGKGGMGTVYEAEQVALKRMVALKVLSREAARGDPTFPQRFERECRAQGELDHPNIVSVFQNGNSPHGQWLAMQLVRGRTLEQMLEAEPLEPEAVLGLLEPIADALEAAHAKGLIHRDVTLRNILVADNGTPFLADFGVTKRVDEHSLTKAGDFIGSLRYAAPEQIRLATVPASDVYSLAVVLYRCLCGRFPFEAPGADALFFEQLRDLPPAPTSVNPSLRRTLDTVLGEGLAKDPAKRFGRPSELIADARASFEGRELKHVAPRRPLPVRALIIVALFLFVLGLGAGALASGASRHEGHRVRAGSLEVSVPKGWVRENGVVARFPRLQLADPLTLVPVRGAGKEAVVVGMSLARGKTLLPFSLRPFYGPSPPVTALSLGSLQALRYEGLGPKPKTEPWTVIVSPTSVGVATIVCRGAVQRSYLRRTCQGLAGSLKLLDGSAYPVGPSAEFATMLRRQFGDLNRGMRRLHRRLSAASGGSAQAAAAGTMADLHRRCARILAAVPVSPQAAAHLAGLVTALRFLRDDYKDLAAAYRAEDARAYHTALGEIGMSASILYNRIHWLDGLGYRIAENYP